MSQRDAYDEHLRDAYDEHSPPTMKRKEPPASSDGNSKKQQKVAEPENRAIFVTNIPRDASVGEIEEVFKKYGMIDQGVDGNPRIKMYANDEGDFNGEALVVYFKKESVDLAITLMDDYEFRLGDYSHGKIKVNEADHSFRKNKDTAKIVTKMGRKERKAAERTRADMQRKLAEWSDNESDVEKKYAPKKNKWGKICILKKVFILSDLEDDVAAILEIKEDMRKAAEKHGEVTKVVLYDKEAEGIVTVRFKEHEGAEKFQKAINGRVYNSEKLVASIADDRPRFQKSPKDGKEDSDDEGYNSVASTHL